MSQCFSEDEFWRACQDLHHKAAEVRNQSFETRILVGPPRYLKVDRRLHDEHIGWNDGDAIEDEPIDDLDEVEDNIVYPAANTSSCTKIEYSIVWSQSFQVPVLYFQILDVDEKTDRLQFVYDHLVPSTRSKELSSIGVMGGVSQTNHPATDVPCFFIHPCKTPEAMSSLTIDRKLSAREYLQIWLGLIGSSVGLNLPIELAI